MKKGLFFLLYCGLFFLPSLAVAAEVLRGHGWRDLNQNSKRTYMLGYMEGYMGGRKQGMIGDGGGVGGVLRWIDEDLCRDKKQAVCTTIRDVLAGKEQMALKGVIFIGFKEGPLHYVNELDAFYEAFPLCRGRAVSDMISELIKVWASPKLEETSTNEIGKQCGK